MTTVFGKLIRTLMHHKITAITYKLYLFVNN